MRIEVSEVLIYLYITTVISGGFFCISTYSKESSISLAGGFENVIYNKFYIYIIS